MKQPKYRSELARKPAIVSMIAAGAALPALMFTSVNASVPVDLDATSLPTGPLETWVNPGVDDFDIPVGDFVSAGTDIPEVVTRAGVNAVLLDNVADDELKTTYYDGPPAPFELEIDGVRSFEAWVYDEPVETDEAIEGVPLGLDFEQNVIAWGRTNATGQNSAFGYGTERQVGAANFVGGGNSVGYGEDNLILNRWTHVAVVYDPFGGPSGTGVVRSYVNGFLTVEDSSGPLNTPGFDGNDPPMPLPMRIGRQNNNDGTANPTAGVSTIALGRVRIHNVALTGEEIRAKVLEEGEEVFWPDTDGGGLPDWYEIELGLDINNAADDTEDKDLDTLSNVDEFLRGTNADNSDTDGDGADDGAEVNRLDPITSEPAPTDPLNPDTDNDNLLDGAEVTAGTDPFDPDTDGDNFPDGVEVAFGSDPLDPEDFPSGERGPLVELDATTLPEGPLESWTNLGVMGGTFVPNITAANVETQAGGVRGLALPGTDASIYIGPGAPASLTGASPRSAEAWLLNPEIVNEDTILAWGSRGSAAQNNAFGHGYSPDFGAFGGWSDNFDSGWGEPLIQIPDPRPNQPDRMRTISDNLTENAWTHVAFTYDPETFTLTVYRDGEVANSDLLTDVLQTPSTDTSGDPLPILIGGQNNNTAKTKAGSMVIAKVKIYDRTLSDQEIKDSFDADAAFFIPPTTDIGQVITGISYDSSVTPNMVTITWDESAIPDGSSIVLQTSGDLMSWVDTGEVLTGGSHTFEPTDPENPGNPIDADRFYRFLIEAAPAE